MQKGKAKGHKLPERFPSGEILLQTQPVKKTWKLGEIIGQGGFGLIYTAYDVTGGSSCQISPFVIKVEPLDNGPLFCEFHFYQRAAKPDLIQGWTRRRGLQYLGVPQFLGSGQHQRGHRQHRFLVLQRLGFNLQKLFEQRGRSLPEKTVLAVGVRMLDALEYIHDKGYCHADIKAANILLGFSNGKTDLNQVYLVDYGLALCYHTEDGHRPYTEHPKRAHDGTIEYTSRDAHKGAYPSRRGDLEILGYCMLEWLTGKLPWESALNNKDRVRDLKIQYMEDIPGFLKACFGTKPYPEGIRRYLEIVGQLAYDAKPKYHQLRQILSSSLSNEWILGLADASCARVVRQNSEGASLPAPHPSKVRPPTRSSRPSTQPTMFQGPARSVPSPSSPPPAPGNTCRVMKSSPHACGMKTPPPPPPASAVSEQSKRASSGSNAVANVSAPGRTRSGKVYSPSLQAEQCAVRNNSTQTEASQKPGDRHCQKPSKASHQVSEGMYHRQSQEVRLQDSGEEDHIGTDEYHPEDDEDNHPENEDDEDYHPGNDEDEDYHPEEDEDYNPEEEDDYHSENEDDEDSHPENEEDEDYQPEEDEDYHPEEDEDYLPEEDEDYHPEEDEDYHPEEDEDYLPEEDEDYHPEEDEDYHPEEDEDYLPEEDEDYHPEEDEDYHPEEDEDSHPEEEEKEDYHCESNRMEHKDSDVQEDERFMNWSENGETKTDNRESYCSIL
ncbi:uncharacterized protein LOC143280874 isoform X3 [Babylonia areolata]|uniref:uncharacterized protein LOC143280874 isoform X3 n=1 Tax=Babylonia areolata TaxID=304850 RepID=UPI003FD48235